MTGAVPVSVAARADGSPSTRSVRRRRLRMRILPLKRASNEIAHTQPPGVNSQGRIDSAGARENASVCHVESVHPVHLAISVYYGIGGVSSANQRAADMSRSVQPDSARKGCETGFRERPLKRPGERL